MTAAFPVHAQTVPRVFRQRILALPQGTGPACILCTYGGVDPGSALRDCARLLARRGYTVLAAAELPDRHSYDRSHCPGLEVPRRWRDEELSAFAQAVRDKLSAQPSPVRLPHRLSPGRYLPQHAMAALGTRYPAPDAQLCTHCGRCAAVCPTGAALGDKKRCIRCAACVDACPSGARRLELRTWVTRQYLARSIRAPKEPAFYL